MKSQDKIEAAIWLAIIAAIFIPSLWIKLPIATAVVLVALNSVKWR